MRQVFRKHRLEALEEFVTSAIEKRRGSLDLQAERAAQRSRVARICCYRIAVKLPSEKFSDTVWYYGNVYDPVTEQRR